MDMLYQINIDFFLCHFNDFGPFLDGYANVLERFNLSASLCESVEIISNEDGNKKMPNDSQRLDEVIGYGNFS